MYLFRVKIKIKMKIKRKGRKGKERKGKIQARQTQHQVGEEHSNPHRPQDQDWELGSGRLFLSSSLFPTRSFPCHFSMSL